MRIARLAIIGSALLAIPGNSGAAECVWQWVNPNPPRVTVNRAVHAVGQYLAVGTGGVVLTSRDGEQWTPRSSGTDADLFGVDVASQRWVAVGRGVVISSRDGEAWDTVFNDQNVVLADVDFGASRFVAVGEGLFGDVLTSPDGDQWERVPTVMPDPVHGLVWAGDSFYACASNEIYRSGDGLQWHFVGTVPLATKDHLYGLQRADLAWTGQRLIWFGGTQAWISENGEDWSLTMTVDGCEDLSSFVGVMAISQTVVLSGYGACPSGSTLPVAQLYTSNDGGLTWAETYQGLCGGFPALVHSSGMYVALGDAGDLVTSSDAQTWQCAGAGCTSGACADGFRAVAAWGDDVLAAGGVGFCDPVKRLDGGSFARRTATDDWLVSPVDTGVVHGVSVGLSTAVAVGDGWAGSSPDGHDWQLQEIPTTKALESVTWGADTFVAVGVEGEMLSSPDGEVWSALWSRTNEDLDAVAWGGDRFVAVGGAGTIVWSHDALNWEIGVTSSPVDLHGVAEGDGIWLAVGDEGTILESTDGIHWFAVTTGIGARLRGAAWDGEAFVVVGSDLESGRAVVLASPDGRHWTEFPVEAPGLRDVIAAGQGLVAVGDDRALIAAGCVGTVASLDPQVRFVPFGETRFFTLAVNRHVESDAIVVLEHSVEGVVESPSSVVIPRGYASVEIPVRGLGFGTAWVTAILPDGLGGGATHARIEVVPAGLGARRPTGRMTP